MVNKILNELFYPFRAQQKRPTIRIFKLVSQSIRLGLDWSRDEFYQSLYENPGPKPVLFVDKAIAEFTLGFLT